MDYENSSNKIWYIVTIVVIVLALGLWYFFSSKSPAPSTPSTATGEVQPTPNNTTSISAEFDQIIDATDQLDQAASASAQAVQGF